MAKNIFFGALIVGLLWGGYWLVSPVFRVIERNDPSPMTVVPQEAPAPIVAKRGQFFPRAHAVSGKAIIIKNPDGSMIVRFEDFETVNGPDLRIYLATDTGAQDIVDLGPIKATKGNINYEIARNVDISKYRYVLVWNRAFSVLFSYAELQPL